VRKAAFPASVGADQACRLLEFALQVHGGFGRCAQGQVVLGTGREPITGVLPLFLSEQHWAVARHRIKPLLGWMCTLNVLGYSRAQLLAVPFLVLAKALRDQQEQDSAHRRKVVQQVGAAAS
jgi:hypothetical protein